MTYDVLVLLTLLLYHPTFNVTNDRSLLCEAQHMSFEVKGGKKMENLISETNMNTVVVLLPYINTCD
jgi:hypothetical protein